MTDHAISGYPTGYRPMERRWQGRDHRLHPSVVGGDDDVGFATPADIAIDMQHHRKDYGSFLRFMTRGGLASALVLGALLLFIY